MSTRGHREHGAVLVVVGLLLESDEHDRLRAGVALGHDLQVLGAVTAVPAPEYVAAVDRQGLDLLREEGREARVVDELVLPTLELDRDPAHAADVLRLTVRGRRQLLLPDVGEGQHEADEGQGRHEPGGTVGGGLRLPGTAEEDAEQQHTVDREHHLGRDGDRGAEATAGLRARGDDRHEHRVEDREEEHHGQPAQGRPQERRADDRELDADRALEDQGHVEGQLVQDLGQVGGAPREELEEGAGGDPEGGQADREGSEVEALLVGHGGRPGTAGEQGYAPQNLGLVSPGRNPRSGSVVQVGGSPAGDLRASWSHGHRRRDGDPDPR